ncbi:MAG: 2-oxoacid:acceptor oxidoreductase family protein [Dehalococcoidia bacterium]|nr:2-oxoacid:acceptor oxidoreductase family protein [Dehalococcoidia bacterium]
MRTGHGKDGSTQAVADGASAVAWVDTHIAQGACAYPITPSTPMGEAFERSVAAGETNLWGEQLVFLEPESEHSSASACEGFALAGGRVSNFTSGQGLVLMKEVLYTIAGKRLPVVFHIGARALTSQALNVHAGHDDVMAVADTGWGMLFARNAQEAADMALIARRAAEDSETPFFMVQDGFVTTHTVQDLRQPGPELMKEFVGAPSERIRNLFDPIAGLMSGVVQNQDSYMKGKIAQRTFYARVEAAVDAAMEHYGELTGRTYHAVEGYRIEDADYVLVGMGSFMETAEVAVDWLRESRGWKVGLASVRMFRPFPGAVLAHLLAGKKAVAVLERMDMPTMQSNPLTLEVKAALMDAGTARRGYEGTVRDPIPLVVSGSAGLGGRDITVGDLVAVFENLRAQHPKDGFALGIRHPDALERAKEPPLRSGGQFAMRGHSVGGWGTNTTNKVLANVAQDLFGCHVQAFSKYGGEKKGLPTEYYLTLSDEPVRTHCDLGQVDLVCVHTPNAFHLGNPLAGLGEGGLLFLQTALGPEEAWEALPPGARTEIVSRGIRVFALDTAAIAREMAPHQDLVQRMQGIALLGVFLRITPFAGRHALAEEQLFAALERPLRKYFGRRGEETIRANLACIRRAYREVAEVQNRSAFLAHAGAAAGGGI